MQMKHSSRSSDRLAVSVSEAAGRLGISRTLAYELAARGELPSVRLGRRIVVPVSALERMVGVSDARVGDVLDEAAG